jgi:LytS/YehU family sensor histidine kinase
VVFFILFMWCSLYFSIKQWQQSSMEKERLLRAESEVREARLLALRYQLNPHFLFNSLNAVSTLVLDGNAPAATRMLAQIGDLLRISLDSEVTTEVALSQELAFTEGYLAIEQTRLGERLRIDMVFHWKRGMPWCRTCCCSRWLRTQCAMGWRHGSKVGGLRSRARCMPTGCEL